MLLFIAAIQLKIFLVFLICYLQVVMALLVGVDFVFYFINLVILEKFLDYGCILQKTFNRKDLYLCVNC